VSCGDLLISRLPTRCDGDRYADNVIRVNEPSGEFLDVCSHWPLKQGRLKQGLEGGKASVALDDDELIALFRS
jgi:hypothetical protein